jgi:hypothetical protein
LYQSSLPNVRDGRAGSGTIEERSLYQLLMSHRLDFKYIVPTQLSEHLPMIQSYCQLMKTQEEQHPTFDITLTLCKNGLRSGV